MLCLHLEKASRLNIQSAKQKSAPARGKHNASPLDHFASGSLAGHADYWLKTKGGTIQAVPKHFPLFVLLRLVVEYKIIFLLIRSKSTPK
jgi:hypothetical protein